LCGCIDKCYQLRNEPNKAPDIWAAYHINSIREYCLVDAVPEHSRIAIRCRSTASGRRQRGNSCLHVAIGKRHEILFGRNLSKRICRWPTTGNGRGFDKSRTVRNFAFRGHGWRTHSRLGGAEKLQLAPRAGSRRATREWNQQPHLIAAERSRLFGRLILFPAQNNEKRSN
jgi:hypothetical protein